MIGFIRKRLKLKKGQVEGVSHEQYTKSMVSETEPNISQYIEQSIPPSRENNRDS